ncbi:MAG TPA: DUF3857 domain-containing protein [Candidatus Acidoferrum sp.]|nr:DUF3857 domain-containing protein [Candidatus Acidoferrum sp.]
MKFFPATLLCLLLAPIFPAGAQQPPSTSPQSSGASSSATKPADYSQEPFVVELLQNKLRFENDGTGQREQIVRIRVQSDAGVQQLGELVFGYGAANETMDVGYVRVRKPDGTAVTAAPDAVKDMTSVVAHDAPVYSDYREKHITVPALHAGDVLEYDIVTHINSALAPNEFWYEQNFVKDAIVLDERLDVDIPKGRAVTIKSAQFSLIHGKEQHATQLQVPGGDGKPQITSDFSQETSGERTIFHWKHANLSRPSDDDDSPKKKNKVNEQAEPDVQITTFKSWEEIAQWYASLEKGRTEPTPEIRAKVAQLTAGKTNDIDKIEALYDYVATNIRYVSLSFGLGRYQPHDSSEVFANQYGDCKDKSTLLVSMLSAAGIQADSVLIPFQRKLDLDVPSPSQFDHLITAVPGVLPDKNELLWMDTTAEVAPFRMLVRKLRDKSALLVPPDGDGKIVTTPADPPFLSTQRVDITGEISDLGKLTAKVHYILRGDNEFVLRVAFRRTPRTQWKQLGQTLAALDGIRGEVTSVDPSDPSAIRDPFELTFEFNEPNYLDWSAKNAKIALPLLTIGLPPADEDDPGPIKLGSPLDVDMTLRLTLPANFTAQPPVAISVSRDYAEFKSSYQFDNHVLTASRSLDFKMREIPASRFSDYSAFERAVASDETQQLLVENSITGAPAIPSTAKPDELFEAGIAALGSGNPNAAIPLLKRVVELDPNHKDAWNDLGLAYLRIGDFPNAADAFQKQIAANPYDEHAYDYLGVTLQQEQKFPDAVAAYRKQIDINPLDPVAHAALGSLYVTEHQYPLAVPELEKAVILSPDNAQLQVTLGQAYLNIGEKEKGLASFDRGVGMAQTPVVWNNVAYALADKQMELDKALQYAQSAVTTVASSLRNADLSQLTVDQLAAVESLGAYWDTLGWVYFQKGDLDAAQKYISAAWRLNGHGEVADHLAQIEAKRGNKDAAEKLYAEGIAAPNSVPETRGRLAALLGVDEKDKKIDKLVDAARQDLAASNQVPVGALVNQDGSAVFFLAVAPGANGHGQVEAAKFRSGSDSFQPAAISLRGIDLGPVFPDATPTKLIRSGTLTCHAASHSCSLTLANPENVRTVN